MFSDITLLGVMFMGGSAENDPFSEVMARMISYKTGQGSISEFRDIELTVGLSLTASKGAIL